MLLRKIGIGVGLVGLGLVAGIATRPESFRVERTVTVVAPADVVFAYMNDFRQWDRWSPFEKLDPAMKRTFAGASSGVGATYSWAGNFQAGAGTMAIKESAPNQRIAIDLQFQKPFKAHNLTEFTFEPTAEGVRVTWAMSGPNTTLGKAISLVVSMDRMVGKEFERGLAELKSISEKEAARRAQDAGKPDATAVALQ